MIYSLVKRIGIFGNKSVCYVTRQINGEEYTDQHKTKVGICIAIFGVSFAQLGHYAPLGLDILIDAIGYTIHAIGITPVMTKIEHTNGKEARIESVKVPVTITKNDNGRNKKLETKLLQRRKRKYH